MKQPSSFKLKNKNLKIKHGQDRHELSSPDKKSSNNRISEAYEEKDEGEEYYEEDEI